MIPLTLLKGAIFPAIVAGSVLALNATLEAGFAPGIALFLMSAGTIAVVALAEVAAPYRREWAWWRDGQAVNDIAHGVLASLAGPRLGEFATAGLVTAAAAVVATHTSDGFWPADWPLWGQVALAVVLADFTDWAKHWCYHHLAQFWPIHALHHDVDGMHVAKGARLHFLETALRFAIISAPLLVLGAGPLVLVWYGAILNFLGMLNHSNIDMPMPGFAHYLFQTPQNHRLHHALDDDLGRSNLSAISMLPDLLFGTFRHPHRHALGAVGVADSPIPQNLPAQIVAPFVWPLLKKGNR